MRIGIPRSLLFYHFYPLWRVFLEELGCEVVLSPSTNRAILERGVELAHSDACLPVKVAFGHVEYLKPKVDALFLPYIVRLEPKRWLCPKIIGFPDMAKAAISDLPPIIAPSLDMRKRDIDRSYYQAGRGLNRDGGRVRVALQRAKEAQMNFEDSLLEREPPSWLDSRKHSDGDLKFGIVSHPYITYDHFLNSGLLRMLEREGVTVLTSEMVQPNAIQLQGSSIRKRIYYTYGKTNVGAAFNFFRSGEVDALIYLLSFSCGPDSLLKELIDAEARSSPIPYMSLTLDEHSGVGGLQTRVEAFVDMVRRRR